MNEATLRQFLSGAALAVSVSSICYLLIDQQPAEGSISDLGTKISRIEAGLATLQRENQDLKEEGRLLRAAIENSRGTAWQSEESQAMHRHRVAGEYLEIVEKSQANANTMISVLSSETSISKDKLVPMRNVFSEASIRIANVLADAQDMDEEQGINRKISEINQWKDDTLAALLSKEEFDQYKSFNWMKKLGPGDGK